MADQWRQTEPGVFQRKACPMERWMIKLSNMGSGSQKQHMSLTVAIQLQMEIAPLEFAAELHRAWLTIRRDHGTLASILDHQTEMWTYNAPNEAEITEWLGETFMAITDPIPGPGILQIFPPPKRPTLYFLLDSNEIVLRAPPTHIDHKGILLLAGTILRHATNPDKVWPVFKWINLSPPYHTTVCLPAHTYYDIAKAEREMTRYLADLPSMRLPTLGLERARSDNSPGETREITMHLSEFQTKHILELIAEEGFHYHHAVHAGIACATKKFHVNDNSDIYTGISYVDGRGHFDLDYHPAAVYSTAWFPSIKVTDFWTVMRQFKHGYQEIAQDPILPNVVDEMINLAIPQMRHVDFCPTEALLTNLGILDRFIPDTGCDVRVANFELRCEILTPAISVFVFFQRNELTLKAFFNDKYHDPEMAFDFLNRVMMEMHRGFDVPWSMDE
ncbi:uncharacterized protein N7484_003229 [Penicillium longicatenatum]|uniref:uncharacterized protein n=1 Tax=Penicillium longicatenatum TaxID=1561947 RepID=UPI002547E593|nr:uncharacterized protein N7484_003229 [Penicillium longicatenatum]KAJ5649506.1 hypothetical protein N7484_003229 [Penicillium longicatenatum]